MPGNASWKRPALVTRLLSSTCALSLRQARVLPPLHAFDIPPPPLLCPPLISPSLARPASRQLGHHVADAAGDPPHARVTDPPPLAIQQPRARVLVASPGRPA